MRLKFVGTGTCVDTGRAQSCIMLESEEARILVDLGVGAFSKLETLDIDAVLITHNHLDHNGDLLALLKARWLMGYDVIEIYGPLGTKAYLESLLEAYSYLRRKLRFVVSEEDEFKVKNLRVKSVPTKHSIISRAYVIENEGRRVVISGDTAPMKELMEIECDLLIHEMSLPEGMSDSHTTPESFAEVLPFCRAGRVVLTHMYPQTREIAREIVDRLRYVRDDIEYIVAEDSMVVEV